MKNNNINQAKNSKIQYRCKNCGYIFEGDIEKEIINYVCPVCKCPKSSFEKIITA